MYEQYHHKSQGIKDKSCAFTIAIRQPSRRFTLNFSYSLLTYMKVGLSIRLHINTHDFKSFNDL